MKKIHQTNSLIQINNRKTIQKIQYHQRFQQLMKTKITHIKTLLIINLRKTLAILVQSK